MRTSRHGYCQSVLLLERSAARAFASLPNRRTVVCFRLDNTEHFLDRSLGSSRGGGRRFVVNNSAVSDGVGKLPASISAASIIDLVSIKGLPSLLGKCDDQPLEIALAFAAFDAV